MFIVDKELRELLKEKYNVVINDVDCIEMCHIQLVINTVRDFDKRNNDSMDASFIGDNCV